MTKLTRGQTWDKNLQLKDAGAVTATGNGQVSAADMIRNLGTGRVDSRVIVDVAAIDVSSADESYRLMVQCSSDPAFATDVVTVAMKHLGDSSVTLETVDSIVGRYEIPFTNDHVGKLYQYLRIRHVIAGTTPSINYTANVAKN